MGMAHAQTHPQRGGGHISALDQYSTSAPALRRGSEHHLPRSPPGFGPGTLRRHQMTGSQGSLGGLASPTAPRMDASTYGHRVGQNAVPPLQTLQMLGTLNYMDSSLTPIKVDIMGNVDKGPFLSCDREWTCYRRNYLACACSYTLSPAYFPSMPAQFTPNASGTAASSTQTYQVYGFAMCISAVVAENEQQHIELVQHTPKRDKGPISKPTKVPMAPKPGTPVHHAHAHAHVHAHGHSHTMGPYGDGPPMPTMTPMGGQRGLYPDGLGVAAPVPQHLPAEHTFERIQFKNATLNNGKRRAAQQYYHLIIELWADIGNQGPEPYVKVAFRKSAKMIVRGRSPGHYHNERRGSQGSGPGGSAGNSLSGSYPAMSHMGPDLNGTMLGGAGTGGYTTSYDGRGVYGGMRHHDMTDDAIMHPDDGKALEGPKTYHYCATTPLYDGGHHDRVDMFTHRNGADNNVIPSMTADSKVKHEYDFGALPRPFNPPGVPAPRGGDQHRAPDPFVDGKVATTGYYPSAISSGNVVYT